MSRETKFHPRPLIKLHPADDGAGLPNGLTFAPLDEFVPNKDPAGHVEKWGIFLPEGVEEDPNAEMNYMQRMMRPQQVRHLYPDRLPEIRYVNALIERKISKLEKLDVSELKKADFIIKVSLGVWRDPNPQIWRRFRVSGGLSLAILADKILSPLMGWTRNFHAHFFTDYRDGSLFGPKDCASLDMVHMGQHGFEFIPEAKWSISHLLMKPGDKAEWKYDLGDQWTHIMELESIIPQEESTGKFAVLEGKGACPRENGGGMWSWNEEVQTLRTGSRADKHELLHQIYAAPNYSDKITGNRIPDTFDPSYFSPAETTAAVKNALSLPGSHRLGARKYTVPLLPGGLTMSDMDPKTKKEHKMKTPLEGGVIMEESTTGKRDGVSANACSNCGTPHGLSLDTRCRAVYYCGKECQVEHWVARHKKDCKRLAKLGLHTHAN